MGTKGLTLWSEFKAFAIRGNVMDLALGVVIGASFTAIVNSFVKDIIMPPLGFLLNGVDFTNLYINLSGSHFASLAAAQAAGAPTINYGLFLNAVIDFAIIALVLFIVIRQINRLRRQERQAPSEATEKNCPYCYLAVAKRATRCPHCTSRL